ncbi:MAG: hypothetical protein JXB49_32645 [Bacteroidales bacterium]|nr:hypothetical protein [Bacteroidales bacterium]
MKLPSRYEDLAESYKGRILPDNQLIQIVKSAEKSIRINGGIRFLPIYGESGSGKSCSSIELKTHLPQTHTFILTQTEISNKTNLLERIIEENRFHSNKILIPIIDQFEENVSGKEKIPTQFIEFISLFDRNELRQIPTVFIWLTTNRNFQQSLVEATSRNKRILISNNFEVKGPEKRFWTQIIKDTFSIHNHEKELSDYLIIDNDIDEFVLRNNTLGKTIELVSEKLAEHIDEIQDLFEYKVILFWPVSDSVRNQRVIQFSRPREGYKLDWEAFYRELSSDERKQLPLDVYNRTRLYFDIRIVPFRAADMHRLFLDLDNEKTLLGKTYLTRFQHTHFFHILSDNWEKYKYNPVRERESKRSKEAEEWYKSVTTVPTKVGRRLAKVISSLGYDAKHEVDLASEYSTVRADVFIDKSAPPKSKLIIELKVFSADNTMPSTIKEQIKVTLRRHALFAGFMKKN